MPPLPPLEIKALARIMNELDYYQMLSLERGASSKEVRQAFHASSRTFHPDANRHLDAEALADCTAISKRVTEGYCVLRDPRKRRAYDERLDGEGGVRMQLAEAKAAEKKGNDEARRGKTEQGRQFYQKAAAAMSRSDWSAARNNLQMALTFEPGNDAFKQELEGIKQKCEAARKAG